MNWVGGTRNRLKVKNEKKKQMEFFEKQKYARRMKMYGKQGEQKLSSKPSLDLVSLQMATLTAKQFQNKSSKNKEQRNKVNMEQCSYKNAAQLRRHHNVELPVSPNATPSILQLGDEVKSSQEPQTSSSHHSLRRDIKVSMYHSQQNSPKGSKHSTHVPPNSFCEQHVSSAAREEEFSGLTQPLSHIREKFSEDVFFHFPSSSKGSEGHHGDSLPSHQSQSHGVSSTQMSISSDTSEDSPDTCQDLLVEQDSREVIHLGSDLVKKLPHRYATTPGMVSRTSYVTDVPFQSENSSSSSLENFRRHFRAENHIEGQCRTPSPLICLDTSTENSPKKSSVGSIDLLCHESTNFTSPESVCDQGQERREKCKGKMMPGTGDGNTGKEIMENDSPSRWLTSKKATTDKQPGMKTTLEWKSVSAGGVPQEPRTFFGDTPALDGQHKEGLLPVTSKSEGVPFEGNSFTRAVLKEVLDLDAELNKHQSPGEEYRPVKRQKVLPYSLESFSSSVPSSLDKSCNPTETSPCEKTRSLLSDKVITPPVSPFTRDVQRRALQSIASLTPVKSMPKLRNTLNLEGKLCVSELSDSDIKTQGELSKTSSGQIYSESQPKTSSVIPSSIISRDREIQCQIAPVQPSRKEQSTQVCSVPNSGLRKDIQIQTCEPLQCDACTQYESQVTSGSEIQNSGNVCSSLKSEENLISDDAKVTDLKEMDNTASSMKPNEIEGGNCTPAADGKLNLEVGEQPIELLSQSTYSDSFDSCTSV